MFVNASPSPMTERDCGDAVRMMFSSREEIAELFEGMAARLVTRMRRICDEAKRAREAEFPIPPEDDAGGRSAQPVVAPQGAQVIKASTPEALKTEEAGVDKVSG